MPRVGSYTYPLFRLNSLLKETKTLYEKFGEKEFTRDRVAQVLGQKATSGGLSQKLADLKSYGLISNTSGRFTVTDVGIKATYPANELERTDSLDKAVRNISLWRAIYEKGGKDPLADTFNLELAEITGITHSESQNVAVSIRKSYIEDAKYIKPVEKPVQTPESQKSETRGDVGADRKPTMETASQLSQNPPPMPTGNVLSVYVPQIGASIAVNDEKTYRAAKIFWDDVAAEWEEKIKAKKEQSNENSGDT